jgi:L-idonate 5-dehydrogenase
MLACVIHGVQDLRLEPSEVPHLEANEVLVRFGAGGICGSDLHYFQHGGVGDFKLRQPMVLGHEVSGEVVQVGALVSRVQIGDRVAIDPSKPCRQCRDCLSGRSNLCQQMRFFGSAAIFPHVQGAFAEFFKVADFQCHVVPSSIPFEVVACAEPLAVTLHAVARAGALMGLRVLVTGAGPIGVLTVAAARLAGAAEVVVTDLFDQPLQVARAMGATDVVNIVKEPERLVQFEQHKGVFDLAIEASGNAKGLECCVLSTRPGGRLVQIGMLPPGLTSAPINRIIAKELDFLGTFRFHQEFAWAVEALISGKIDVAPMLSAQFAFSDAVKAFELASDRQVAMKVSLLRDSVYG